MSKFKVGDTVSYKHDDGKTYTGVVIEINSGLNRDRNLCKFEGFDGHTACISSKNGPYNTYDHYYVKDSELILIEAEKSQPIVIYRKGMEVIALDKNTGRKAVAKCNPEDAFDFNTGARLAFDRLMGIKNTSEPEKKSKAPHLELAGRGFLYGTLGTKTKYKDCNGRALCVGDQVKIFAKLSKTSFEVKSIVVECDGNLFLMGIESDCDEKTGKINDWKVTKTKDHAHLHIGDEIIIAPHIRFDVKA